MSGGIGGGEPGVPDDLLTTKGDSHGFDTANARVPIGADTQVLTADSTQALGLGWAAPTSTEVLSVIETQETTGTPTEMNFTFSALDMDDDSFLKLEFDGVPTAALTLGLQVNNLTVGYYSEGYRLTSGVMTLLDHNNLAYMPVASSSLMGGANQSACILMEIMLPKGITGASRSPMMFSKAHGLVQDEEILSCGNTTSNITSLTQVKLLVDTSTLVAGCRATLYKFRRAAA